MQHISSTLFQLRGKLSDIEALVQPRLLQQSLVRSTLDDTPLLHHQNLVRSLYRREAVSDGYHGSPLAQVLQGCLNEPFYLRGERTGGFVQQPIRGPAQERAFGSHPPLSPPRAPGT